jgi:hypothetical protein
MSKKILDEIKNLETLEFKILKNNTLSLADLFFLKNMNQFSWKVIHAILR